MDIQKNQTQESFEKLYVKNAPDWSLERDQDGGYKYHATQSAFLLFEQQQVEIDLLKAELAKAQAVPEVKLSHCVTLTCAQLREAFLFGAPDEDDQEQLETEMTITWSEDGHSGKGYYCYYSELPEEGAIFLDEVIEAQEQKG